MWPLSLTLLFALAAPSQQDINPQLREQAVKTLQSRLLTLGGPVDRRLAPEMLEAERANTCYTVRSYHFQRQDGLAPVMVGTSTCTPANKLQRRQVKRGPAGLFVPLTFPAGDEKPSN